jgi:hypothetical protein
MTDSLPYHDNIDYIEGTNIPLNSENWIQTNQYTRSRATRRVVGHIYTDEQKQKILNDFINKLTSHQKDLDPDIIKMINDNFWDLF